MKKILTLLTIVFILLSCKKEDTPEPVIPDYYGTYYSSKNDTVIVSQNKGNYIKISWHPYGYKYGGILFDSVIIAPNRTFTDNETAYFFGNQHTIGTGSFGANTIDFHFIIDGGDIFFSGVKQ